MLYNLDYTYIIYDLGFINIHKIKYFYVYKKCTLHNYLFLQLYHKLSKFCGVVTLYSSSFVPHSAANAKNRRELDF